MLKTGLVFVAVLMFTSVAVSFASSVKDASNGPEQVHLAFGLGYTTMRVNFVTQGAATNGSSHVEWGPSADQLKYSAPAVVTLFTVDAGRVWSIHVAEMDNLEQNTVYYYRVVANNNASAVYHYTSNFEEPRDTPQTYVIYGDLGTTDAFSLCWDCDASESCVCKNTTAGIISEVDKADLVVHVGDFAYNLNDEDGRFGDNFMRNIEPVAAHMPYMVSCGNHEGHQNFAHYTERFRHMPTTTGSVKTDNGYAPNNWYYSFNHGLVHIAAISTEIYFDYPDMIEQQFNWLKQDLASVNRTKTPWLIVHGHRSVYCSCDHDCVGAAVAIRDGQYGLEQLLHEYGVDLFVNGHEHNYERMFDIYKGKTNQTTVNPKATTYIITGSAGCAEGHEPFILPQPRTSAFRSNTFGYSRFMIHNATHLHWQQVQTQKDHPVDQQNYGHVIDDVWFVQEHHGSFSKHKQFYEEMAVPTGLGSSKSITMDFVTRETFTADRPPTPDYYTLAKNKYLQN